VLANSRKAYTPTKRVMERGQQAVWGSENFGGFIMTHDHDVYMAKHTVGEEDSFSGIFHSSYTAGDPVLMAGTMLIEGGAVKAVRSDSGHYLPKEMNMANCLKGLAMLGVSLANVHVLDHNGKDCGLAPAFLSWGLSLERYVKHREEQLKHHGVTQATRDMYNAPSDTPTAQREMVHNEEGQQVKVYN